MTCAFEEGQSTGHIMFSTFERSLQLAISHTCGALLDCFAPLVSYLPDKHFLEDAMAARTRQSQKCVVARFLAGGVRIASIRCSNPIVFFVG